MVDPNNISKPVIRALAQIQDNEPTIDEQMDRYGYPEYKRLEINIRDQFSLRESSEILSSLAMRLSGLSRVTDRPPRSALMEAAFEIDMACKKLKQVRLRDKIDTKSSR